MLSTRRKRPPTPPNSDGNTARCVFLFSAGVPIVRREFAFRTGPTRVTPIYYYNICPVVVGFPDDDDDVDDREAAVSTTTVVYYIIY